MTPEQWEALIPRVTLPGFSPPVRLHYAGAAQGPTVVIERDLVDVDTGQPKTFRTVEPLPCWPSGFVRPPAFRAKDEQDGLRYLVSCVGRALKHEVEELLQVDGRKAFYPHGAGGR